MSQEDPPRVSRDQFQAFLDALNAQDFDALVVLIRSELRFRSVLGGAEGAEPYAGIEGMRTWRREVDAVWENWHQEVVDYRQVNDHQAVIVVRATGRAKASGVPLDSLTGNVLTWREGLGWEMVAYSNPREALEAVGLSE